MKRKHRSKAEVAEYAEGIFDHTCTHWKATKCRRRGRGGKCICSCHWEAAGIDPAQGYMVHSDDDIPF